VRVFSYLAERGMWVRTQISRLALFAAYQSRSGTARQAASEGSWFEPSAASSRVRPSGRRARRASDRRSRSNPAPVRPATALMGQDPVPARNLPSAPISCMIPTGKGVEANQRMAVRRVGTPVNIHRKGRLLSPDIPRFLLNNNNLRATALRFCITAGVLAPIFNIRHFRLPFSSYAMPTIFRGRPLSTLACKYATDT